MSFVIRAVPIMLLILVTLVCGCCPERRTCAYPQSHPLNVTMEEALQAIHAHAGGSAERIFLDTVDGHQNTALREGEDHHQGIARSQKMSDGSVHFFLTHSEMDDGDQSQVMQFAYNGPVIGEHIVQSYPKRTVALMTDQVELVEQHPSDLDYLPDINGYDGGYIFVTESNQQHRLVVYHFKPGQKLRMVGSINHDGPGPTFVFVDKVDDDQYVLGLGYQHEFTHPGGRSEHRILGTVYAAHARDLFPTCREGEMVVAAFKPVSHPSRGSDINVPMYENTSQVKLVRDTTSQWYLLAFRGDTDDEDATDYVHAFRVTSFAPFRVDEANVISRHVTLQPGATSFTSTGNAHVEPSGRLLLFSSSRWAHEDDEAEPGHGYISAVDEIGSN